MSPNPVRPVREHPAPSGALRLVDLGRYRPGAAVGGYPAPSGALRPDSHCAGCGRDSLLREHPAPSGALRPGGAEPHQIYVIPVREHLAPSGALRHLADADLSIVVVEVRGHRAPSGALRRGELFTDSGFAQRQGAPSTVRCICALAPEEQVVVLCPSARVAEADRHRGGAACGCGISISPVSFCSVVRTQGARIRQRCSHTRAELSRCVRCCVALFRSLCA